MSVPWAVAAHVRSHKTRRHWQELISLGLGLPPLLAESPESR